MRNIADEGDATYGNTVIQVLLAEDEFLIRFDIAEAIRELGWHVYEVATADEGIEMIERGTRIDLLVSDINMPGARDGTDLASVVRRLCPEARVALTSGMVRGSSLPEGLFDLFMPKPVPDVAVQLSRLMSQFARTR